MILYRLAIERVFTHPFVECIIEPDLEQYYRRLKDMAMFNFFSGIRTSGLSPSGTRIGIGLYEIRMFNSHGIDRFLVHHEEPAGPSTLTWNNRRSLGWFWFFPSETNGGAFTGVNSNGWSKVRPLELMW